MIELVVLWLGSLLSFAEPPPPAPPAPVISNRTHASALPPSPNRTVVYADNGGPIAAHKQRWVLAGAMGDTVEIRGPCASACTQVMSYVPRQRICFDDNGLLAFHLTRNQNLATGEWVRNDADTKALVESYPTDIQDWIDSRGGYLQLPFNSWWVLRAPELWAMGYSRCV
jgi:hypothetical protein